MQLASQLVGQVHNQRLTADPLPIITPLLNKQINIYAVERFSRSLSAGSQTPSLTPQLMLAMFAGQEQKLHMALMTF